MDSATGERNWAGDHDERLSDDSMTMRPWSAPGCWCHETSGLPLASSDQMRASGPMTDSRRLEMPVPLSSPSGLAGAGSSSLVPGDPPGAAEARQLPGLA